MQYLYGSHVVALLLSGELEKVLSMWHLELPEMKADLTCSRGPGKGYRRHVSRRGNRRAAV